MMKGLNKQFNIKQNNLLPKISYILLWLNKINDNGICFTFELFLNWPFEDHLLDLTDS